MVSAGSSDVCTAGLADGLISTTGDNTSTTTTTGIDGFYNFTGLTPGVQYQVQFAAPAGYVFRSQDHAAEPPALAEIISPGKTQNITIASGQYKPTLDSGVYP